MNYRVCRDCGEEFRPEVARCSDCGGELGDVYEDETGRVIGAPETYAGAPETSAAPPPDLADFRPIFVGTQAAALVPLAQRLEEAEVPFHLVQELADPERGTARYGLLVREVDRARGLQALAALLGAEGEGRLSAVETHFTEGERYARCPACDAVIAAGAAECPECGLVVAGGGGAD
jgi:uncharacterized OB-fold protein